MAALGLTRSVHFAATLLLAAGLVFQFLVLAPDPGASAGLLATMRAFLRRALIALWAAVLSGEARIFLLAGEIAGVSPCAKTSTGRC